MDATIWTLFYGGILRVVWYVGVMRDADKNLRWKLGYFMEWTVKSHSVRHQEVCVCVCAIPCVFGLSSYMCEWGERENPVEKIELTRLSQTYSGVDRAVFYSMTAWREWIANLLLIKFMCVCVSGLKVWTNVWVYVGRIFFPGRQHSSFNSCPAYKYLRWSHTHTSVQHWLQIHSDTWGVCNKPTGHTHTQPERQWP